MRTLLLTLALLLPSLHAQTPQADIQKALIGDWTGVLEYRDYKEPPTSTKRVQLPTWLSISSAGDKLTQHFIYDDGPNKTVDSTDLITFDPAASTYTNTPAGKPAQVYKVTGYDTLKTGRGTLILLGPGTENGKPTEIRITLAIRRNLLTMLEETRPAAGTEPFAFRHTYTFTRAQVPTVTPAK